MCLPHGLAVCECECGGGSGGGGGGGGVVVSFWRHPKAKENACEKT